MDVNDISGVHAAPKPTQWIPFQRDEQSVLPGFRATMGFTVFYLSLIVIVPLSLLVFKTASLSFGEFCEIITSPRVVAAYRLTFGASLLAALLNAFFGLLIAWILVRYNFKGKTLIDMLIDLPFALPTAVAGISLTTAFSANGIIGKFLVPLGIQIPFTQAGIILALTFIGLPFVVRSVQPVLKELDRDMEEAATCLGAKRWQIFWDIIFPTIFPALLSGFAMAFARAIGEYGSVVFIAGNLPFKTEIVPLIIIAKLEQYDYVGATAIATVMLFVSFVALFVLNKLQWWSHQRNKGKS